MNELFKRKGIIPISRELFNENPEAILKVFENVLIIKADNDFFKNEITYYAYSKHFDIVKEGEKIPTYIANVKGEFSPENILIKETIEWERVD